MGNFQGYPSLLRQIKHRVSFAQQKAMYAATRSSCILQERQYLLYSRISNFTIANLYIKGGFYSETAFLYALHSFPHFPQKVSSRLCY